MPDIVSLAVIHCGLPTAGGASRSGAVVGVAADDDGVVPGRSGGGVTDGGAFEDLVKKRDIGRSPMESVAWRPQ